MHLWTEYEGRTIAEHYTLGKLLRSEGRNGFFATADKDGHPAVIRLTEAHFDEAEQLERWRHVAEVHQDNLIEIEQVGQTTFEGVALTYALMEPDDANLGDVLKERPLTTTETLQVARAVLAALHALHTSGLVHEHVEPANVLAVGETVKLRSDCVRECIADGEFATEETCADLRRADLHGYGVLLLRCLTLESEWVPAHNNLAEPFKRLIPRALDGTWSVEQIQALLEPPPNAYHGARATGPAASSNSYSAPTRPDAASARSASAASASPTLRPEGTDARPLVPPSARQAPAADAPVSSGPSLSIPRRDTLFEPEATSPLATRRRALPEEPVAEPSRAIWLVLAAVALLILGLAWHFFFGKSAGAPSKTPVAASEPAPAVRPAQPSAASAVRNAQSNPSSAVAATHNAAPASVDAPAAVTRTPGWYVIAWTYNREGEAANKVAHLRRTHDSLHPQVFSPSGHAPYFVSLGGAMTSQSEAEAVWRHARRAGLPRDTFVRHY